jgi:integrase
MTMKIRGRGEGSIHQRSNGTWRAQISVNGKRISYGAKTKVECQAWLHQMHFQLVQGHDFQGGKSTLGEYLGKWLESYKVAIRPKTHHRYKGLVDKYIIPHIGNITLKDLHPLNIEKFYGDLLDSGVGPRNVRHIHAVLHRALEKAVGYRLILRNPAHGVTLPQYKPAEMQIWDESQVSVFLIAAESSRFKALYHLAITTGMRQGEIFGLKWSDLHWNSGTIQVQRQVQYVPGQGRNFVEPKTRASRRKIKLGEGTLHALRLHKEGQSTLIAVAGERWVDHDLIFPNTVGNPLDPSNLRRDFNRIIDTTGLPKIRFHDLRHSSASLLLNHGVPTIVVSRILGHSKPSTTLDIYGHLYHEMQGEAARIMDDLVTPIRVELNKAEKPISR